MPAGLASAPGVVAGLSAHRAAGLYCRLVAGAWADAAAAGVVSPPAVPVLWVAGCRCFAGLVWPVGYPVVWPGYCCFAVL